MAALETGAACVDGRGERVMDELKPCPFCGAFAELWVTYTIQDKDNPTAVELQEQISYSRMFKVICPSWNRRNYNEYSN